MIYDHKTHFITKIGLSKNYSFRYEATIYNSITGENEVLCFGNKGQKIYSDRTKIGFYTNSKRYRATNDPKDKERFIMKNRKMILSGLCKEYIEYRFLYT